MIKENREEKLKSNKLIGNL